MSKLDRYQPKERPDIQDNIYIALIKKIDKKVWSEDSKTFNWTFELAQPPYIGKKVWVWGTTGTSPTPKACLTAWGSVLGMSREDLADENFDTDSFVGKYVKVLVKTWGKENGEPKQGVTELLAMTDVDTQILQKFLADANVTGSIQVAAAAPTVSHPVPAVQQPVAVTTPAPVPQPVVHQPVGTAAPAQVERKRPSSLPF